LLLHETNTQAHTDGTLVVGIRSSTVEIKTFIRGLNCSADPIAADDDDDASQSQPARAPLQTVTVRA
jgi:hypothetical protein